jgi:hypothetical protein
MSDTLSGKRNTKFQTTAGNHTASRTVLNGSFSNGRRQEGRTSRHFNISKHILWAKAYMRYIISS